MYKPIYNMHRKRVHKNTTALIAAILLLIVAFTMPLVGVNFLGADINNSGAILFRIIENIFVTEFSSSYAITLLSMTIIFLIAFFLYLLNGLGIIRNKYSRYASYLTLIYCLIGFYFTYEINKGLSLPLLGNALGNINAGPGIYLVIIVGIFYMSLKKYINAIHL
jgi:hypothetical protein